jgi:hypothetical protein
LGCVAFAGVAIFAPFSGAQQKTTQVARANISYDLSRETVVQGTVVSFTASSQVTPFGPHATIHTASGNVDVHLGNADTMKSKDIFLEAGDSVKIVGASHNFGNEDVFLARVLQKGNQVVALRNRNGIPLSPTRATVVKSRSILGGPR